jgi:hypothetical protein
LIICPLSRRCEERSDAAIQETAPQGWIASSQGLLAMTAEETGTIIPFCETSEMGLFGAEYPIAFVFTCALIKNESQSAESEGGASAQADE